MSGRNKTKTKKYKSERPSYSTKSKGRTKASRRAAKASADPKTPSPQPKQSQKRPRSKSPVATPPSSAKKRTTAAPIDKSFELAGTIIRTCIKDHWWRVTPDPCAKDDICVGSQQEWSNVLPVLIEAGLLDTKRIDGASFDLIYNSDKWKKMRDDLDMNHGIVMHLSPFRPRGKKKSHYFCLQLKKKQSKNDRMASKMANTPKFSGPSAQIKVMYLGVVARPRPDKAFNGRIMLKRVANTKKVEAKTRNELFSTDVKINYAIRHGDERGHKDWYDLHTDGMTAGDLCDSIAQFYELSEFVSDRLEFHFPDYKPNGEQKTGQSKYRVVKDDEVLSSLERFTPESQGQKVKVELKDLRLAVRYKEGDTVTRDVNCDSKWMLSAMEEVAKGIREAYSSWVPATDTIYLVMDNAGGHGTKDAVDQYTKELLDKHNIEIIQQVPRSPETNVLDLGIWMSLQSAVEKEHHGRRCDADALDETVMKVWGDVASEDAFKNVFGKLPIIHANIKNCSGGNDTVESNRGKVGAAKVAAEEADRNAEGNEGEPLWTLDAFEDEDMEGEDIDEVEDDEGVINLL